MTRAPITTHILNLSTGTPAAGVKATLTSPQSNTPVACGVTDADGRISQWDQEISLTPGTWSIDFSTASWFSERGEDSFYDNVTLSFKVVDTEQHYHVPLLLNAFGYSTYRGS
ncbi:hydroxyisourate hydrolase [Agarilytica rhodophyticola]|uniref:hydroxyisourate hydrolase n=1 Tax=Agarilytica rhodophyticola TaxID=1737490 RepID=UPI000B34656C|nr:hydroxyisourate hydrolase [Agarilytica rhodophyticola]